MGALIKANPQLPAAIAKLVAAAPGALAELTTGVTSGFPIISYKGKVWRIRKGGEELMHTDADNNALPTIDVVLVQANPHPSKIYYDKKYEEGTNEAPRCFSNDGLKPDASVQSPMSAVCASCPMNAWGSRITDNGKKSRACSDARRMAVVFADDLYDNGVECQKFLLRVPPASLNPLKDYAEKVLGPKGIPFFGIVTRIGFDVNAAHPQFTLRPVRLLNDEEAEAIVALRDSEDVKRILAEAQEFPVAAAADGEEDDGPASGAAAPAPAPAAKATTAATGSQKKPPAMRPATDEEAGLEASTPATPPAAKAAKKAAARPAAAAPAQEEFAPAPPPKRGSKSAPAPAAAAPAEEEEEAPAPAPAAPSTKGGDFDSLLDSILNG